MIETQTQAGIQDIDPDNVFVMHRPYSMRKIRHLKNQKTKLSVSLQSFKADIHIFDPEIRQKYTNAQVVAVMKLIFKKAAERIIKKLWRMPFPNGYGSLYMKQAQYESRYEKELALTGAPQTMAEKILREIDLTCRRINLKWNKDHRRFPYRNVWTAVMSKGFFRTLKYNEIVDRAYHDTKTPYRGHII